MRDTITSEEVYGKLLQLIYSPHGTIEGILIESGDGADAHCQLVFADENAGAIFSHVEVGSSIAVTGEFIGWSTTKKEGHRVYRVDVVKSVNGKKPPLAKAIKRMPTYSGKVVALNYARHGEPNGVILDSGDFIHLKPDGFKRAKLAVGDTVQASGDAYELNAERGYAVEARRVNGKTFD